MAGRRKHTRGEIDIASAFASALARQRAGAWREAAALYRRILSQDRGNPQAESQLAVAELRLGDFAGAARRAGRLLKRLPGEAPLHNLLGEALRALGQPEQAAAAFQQANALRPDYAPAINNLGAALVAAGRVADAIPHFERAADLARESWQPLCNLVEALIRCDKYEEAAAALPRLLAVAPDNPRVLQVHHTLLTSTCDWDPLPALSARLDAALADALGRGACPAETPLTNLSRKIDAAEHLCVARAWSAEIARSAGPATKQTARRRARGDRLTIGYLSGDFRDHPVAHLLGGMFGLHDRVAFRVVAYTHGRDDGSPQRRRLNADCDAVVDISASSDRQAAARIAGDGVDILVDLMGHTGASRLGIAALRPAPVQATYLGYPGTTGAAFIDYILTDRVVTPPGGVEWCAEQPVYLPHCYQVNDRQPADLAAAGVRQDHGLPRDGSIVFCSFNQHFKLESVMADIWMAILRDVPDSVLWLAVGNASAERNLTRFAEARGVAGERLRFAPKLPVAAHLARLAHADLGLDTRIYNGHTTTSDMLWLGVPVVTLRGGTFASRVAASILTAHRMPELIAEDPDGYHALAVALARDRDRLRAVRQKVSENRAHSPLFDSRRFVRGLEEAYREIWAVNRSGGKPRPVFVAPQTD